MSGEKRTSNMTMGRWIIVVGALLIQLSLGSLYSWSVFVRPLKTAFPGATAFQLSLPFTIALAAFSVTMVFAGRWQDRSGPKIVATVGGVILGIGNISAGLGNQIEWLYATYGILGGIGIGMAYVCPIAAAVKWFPDKRGLVSGLAVAGFGGGAVIYAQVANYLLAQASLEQSWRQTFLMLGIVYLLTIVVGAQLLRNPPAGWLPEGYVPPSRKAGVSADLSWREMLNTRTFYSLWIMYAFAASSGLMVIGHLAPFGQESGLSAAEAAAAVGVLSLFNSAGRIVWGMMSDRIGRVRTMLAMFCLNAVVMLALIEMGRSMLLLALGASIVGFCFGGVLAVFPSVTADTFGTKYVGVNYGIMFTAYGVAGIIGPILGGAVHDLTFSYLYAFLTAGTLAVIASVLTFTVRVERR